MALDGRTMTEAHRGWARRGRAGSQGGASSAGRRTRAPAVGALWSPTTTGPVSSLAGSLVGDAVVRDHGMTGGGSMGDDPGTLVGPGVVPDHN
jgi:hypothetical protein